MWRLFREDAAVAVGLLLRRSGASAFAAAVVHLLWQSESTRADDHASISEAVTGCCSLLFE